jgi:glycosyltransferase involved in cell wall biosynthesis
LNSQACFPARINPFSISKETALTATVIICTRNRPALLRKCLAAVSKLSPAPDSVLVVDNSTGDRETEELAREYSARYIVEPQIGLSHARNRGLAECNTDVVGYLDDDAEPDEKWLGLLVEAFADPLVAVVTGETVETVSSACDFRQKPARTLSNHDQQWFEIATFGGLGYGTNMALRKSACPGISVFDLRLGRGTPIRIAEESRAFASLLSRGYLAVHVPAAIVVHPPQSRNVEQEATSSMAYWLLLFLESPGHRLDLIRFLYRRVRRIPLSWERDPRDAGDIVSSGWRVYLKAGFGALRLFLRGWK